MGRGQQDHPARQSYPPPPEPPAHGADPGSHLQYQQPYQGQQYSPGPQHGRTRKRHTGRNILLGLCGVVVAIIAIAAAAAAGAGSHTVRTAGSSNAPGTKSAPDTARIGSPITLAGNDSGEQMTVTLTKVISNASGTDYTTPPAGDRLYAAQFQLKDTGSAAYSDAPSNGAEVVDSAGQSYDAAIADSVQNCTSFPAAENIATGSLGLGCVVFEVPTDVRIVSVQFTLDSGMGPDTGQWAVKG
jgi:Domain of unknown function (DUF4352)